MTNPKILASPQKKKVEVRKTPLHIFSKVKAALNNVDLSEQSLIYGIRIIFIIKCMVVNRYNVLRILYYYVKKST